MTKTNPYRLALRGPASYALAYLGGDGTQMATTAWVGLLNRNNNRSYNFWQDVAVPFVCAIEAAAIHATGGFND